MGESWEVRAFAPGRTEIAGNHTDHQGGRVIAATLDCGVEVLARANGTDRAHVESEGFDPVDVAVDDTAPRAGERGMTAALVRGVIAGVARAGVQVRGFDARVSTTVPAGAGLSSSAAFELALAHALVALGSLPRNIWGDSPNVSGRESALIGRPLDVSDALRFARIGQAAERDWFGKPCGLMDQLTIAAGGTVLMDFSKEEATWEPLAFDFEQAGLALFLVDSHSDHSALSDEYARVPADMDEVAHLLGAGRLCDVPEEAFLGRFAEVRTKLGDRAALRALHYYHEMHLVDERAACLRAGDVAGFLAATRRSGASSAQYLQNVSVAGAANQPAMVALAVADRCAGPRGAARIHGGGFGGAVQAFVPVEEARDFSCAVDALLGAGSAKRYRITGKGARAEWIEAAAN